MLKWGTDGDLSPASYLNPVSFNQSFIFPAFCTLKKEGGAILNARRTNQWPLEYAYPCNFLINLNVSLCSSSRFVAFQTMSASSRYQILPRLPSPARSSSSFPSSFSCHCVIAPPPVSAFHPVLQSTPFSEKPPASARLRGLYIVVEIQGELIWWGHAEASDHRRSVTRDTAHWANSGIKKGKDRCRRGWNRPRLWSFVSRFDAVAVIRKPLAFRPSEPIINTKISLKYYCSGVILASCVHWKGWK